MVPSTKSHEHFATKQQHSTSNQQYTYYEKTGGIGDICSSVPFFNPCDHPGQSPR